MDAFRKLVAEAAKAAQERAAALASEAKPVCLYLFYRPSTAKEDGALMMVYDDEPAPAGYSLATGEGLRGNIPYDSYYAWISSRATRLPILSWES